MVVVFTYLCGDETWRCYSENDKYHLQELDDSNDDWKTFAILDKRQWRVLNYKKKLQLPTPYNKKSHIKIFLDYSLKGIR